jgi:hypothetical protein
MSPPTPSKPMPANAVASHRVHELLGRRALGERVAPQLVAWAADMLVEGHDSKSLRFLAGHAETDSPSEIGEEFDRALGELGHSLPPRREALDDYACFVCQCIVNGTVNLDNAHTVLYEIWKETHHDPKKRRMDGRFDIWMYLSDSLQLVEDGYGPILPELEGLSAASYPAFLKLKAGQFLSRYCSLSSASLNSHEESRP